MADINNFSDLNEQFNTVKTMLNSIRAQGILNTSDVDKLLEGINAKLQRIDSVDDIDAIKGFLSELKQNLDERHNVLLSKFGAIESLFSNLLKNSTEAVKSGELKELFDIVATNLSVFSREVVSNKETLSDIILRLDALQADDSKKKEVIKSVGTVRNDIEKLSNGFDSIVISLNENFKTVLKTISEIDQSDAIAGFTEKLNDIITSSNTILSAIQLMDKKNVQIEDMFDGLATQEDTSSIQKNLVDLSLKSKEIGDLVDSMVQKSYKIDNLADKIDAAVNIIAGLKTEIAEKDDEATNAIMEKFSKLEEYVKEISSNTELAEFKSSLEAVLEDMAKGSESLKESLHAVVNNVDMMGESLKLLNIDAKINEVLNDINNSNENIKSKVAQESDKMMQLLEVNTSRTLNEISNNAEILDTRLKDAQGVISELCEKNFNDVAGNILALRNIVSQLEENSVSANNAIFASITDRLTLFENSLKNVLAKSDNNLSETTAGVVEKVLAIKNIIENIDYKADAAALDRTDLKNILENLKESLDSLLALNFTGAVQDFKVDMYALKQDLLDVFNNTENELSEVLKNMLSENSLDFRNNVENILSNSAELRDDFETKLTNLKNSLLDCITEFKQDFTCLNADTLSELKFNSEQNFNSLNNSLNEIDDVFKQGTKNTLEELKSGFDYLKKKITEVDTAVDEDLAHQVSIIEGNFESLNLMLVDIMNQAKEALGDKIKNELSGTTHKLGEVMAEELEQFKTQIEDTFDNLKEHNGAQAEFIKNSVLELNGILKEAIDVQNTNYSLRLDDISNNLRNILAENTENTKADYSILKDKLEEFYNDISATNTELLDSLKAKLDDIIHFVDSNIELQAQEVNTRFDNIFNSVESIKPELDVIKEKIGNLFEETSINLTTQLGNTNSDLSQKINDGIQEINTKFSDLYERLDKDEVSRMSVFQEQISELRDMFNNVVSDLRSFAQNEISTVSETLIKSNQNSIESIRQSVDDAVSTFVTTSADIAAGELTTIENYANKILEKSEEIKQNSNSCRDVIKGLLKEYFENTVKEMQKETDVIIGDVLEQFNVLNDSQKDTVTSLTTSIEGSVSGYIHDAVGDLKSYVDIKTNSSDLKDKLDNLDKQMQSALHETTGNITKLLKESIFNDSIENLKATNQILVESMAEKINSQFEEFITENISKDFSNKISMFDKNVTDTIVNKFEEVKVLSGGYTKSFERISVSVEELVSKFTESKEEVNKNLINLAEGLNQSVDELKAEFLALKAQIMNKSFDEAFHEAVKNQITGVEKLIQEQMGYLEDVQDLCCDNLPELTELNTLVKHSIMQTIADIKTKVEEQNADIPRELDKLKADVITQFLNIFNQISFVTEQEEINDFIQEKHNELITILSHIVTSSDEVINVKDNLAVVDNKIDSIKEDIDLINEKITSIMSAEGDIDYVYSLQDLESDIANLRLVLNEMKANDKAKEFEELINSTNNIYSLVETIKAEMPNFEAEEFKKEFNNLSEDIVSISTRTNKLLLSSDESYKLLQDNLHDFKLVIDDLDERTRNFSKESGIDKLETKLSTLNSMMQNGAKTNQVFNQVFEYLAEWVDRAGIQITEISDKVNSLDEISQIKIMLEDLKAESQDNTESAELVDALSAVFDKQAKRIASLEAKLDRMIVDSTINSKTPDFDITPIEDTLNKFLVVMDDKMSLQQSKINSLEEKLEEVMSLVDNKDTVQLTKKVGGMDKQLAKLNKSIEKIASNVVEK